MDDERRVTLELTEEELWYVFRGLNKYRKGIADKIISTTNIAVELYGYDEAPKPFTDRITKLRAESVSVGKLINTIFDKLPIVKRQEVNGEEG
jgi:hypothetical protein